MSQNDQTAITLPATTIEAVLSATGATGPHAPQMVEGLGQYLSDALQRAVRRSEATPLCKEDVDRLERAYLRFREVIDSLQDCDDPPPHIPKSESGLTDWDHWLIGPQHFGFKQGRREGSDWRLITQLLAVYETVSGRSASASQENGPTMRFLKAALPKLAEHAPAKSRKRLATPQFEATKHQLPKLREFYLPIAVKRIRKLLPK